MEKYYISTAITYTSGKPHIGNTYEIVLADAIVFLVWWTLLISSFLTNFSNHSSYI